VKAPGVARDALPGDDTPVLDVARDVLPVGDTRVRAWGNFWGIGPHPRLQKKR
jgi:hypothetical protein